MCHCGQWTDKAESRRVMISSYPHLAILALASLETRIFGLCGRSVRSFWFPVSRPDACRFRIFVVSISLWYHERYHTRTCYEKTRRWFADIMLEVKPVRRLNVASSCLSPLVVTSDAQVERGVHGSDLFLRRGRVQERGALAHWLTPWWGSLVWPVWSDSRVGTT